MSYSEEELPLLWTWVLGSSHLHVVIGWSQQTASVSAAQIYNRVRDTAMCARRTDGTGGTPAAATSRERQRCPPYDYVRRRHVRTYSYNYKVASGHGTFEWSSVY